MKIYAKNRCRRTRKKTAGICGYLKGNTAQRLCVRCKVRFLVRLHKKLAGILTYVKRFLCDMTENMQADDVQSRQAFFVRCCLNSLYDFYLQLKDVFFLFLFAISDYIISYFSQYKMHKAVEFMHKMIQFYWNQQ